jgi:hypothetical protein
MKKQITSHILMIKPVHFNYNEQTAENNYFQEEIDHLSSQKIQDKALKEFESFVQKLEDHGIHVVTVSDTEKAETPDSVFPNNWVSFHEDGRVGLYPMFAPNRRRERRHDILEMLKNDFEIRDVIDFSASEKDEKYLEGTGSMILDRSQRIVYAALSDRTDESILREFCQVFDFECITFTATQNVDGQRMPIYHTNVMMCVAEDFSVICSDTIQNPVEREKVLTSLKNTGKEIIEISEEQMNHFAGNMLQVHNAKGERFLVMSTAAYESLNSNQVQRIEKYGPIIHSSLETIETCGGGSARCMMAEIFLPEKIKTN